MGTTQQQQVNTYSSWINSAIDSGVQGITHYQVIYSTTFDVLTMLNVSSFRSGERAISQAHPQQRSRINLVLAKQAIPIRFIPLMTGMRRMMMQSRER